MYYDYVVLFRVVDTTMVTMAAMADTTTHMVQTGNSQLLYLRIHMLDST